MPDRKLGWLQDDLNNLAACRIALGLSQIDLAERLGITQASISDYERGMRIPAKRSVQIIDLFKNLLEDRPGLEPEEARRIESLTPDMLQQPYRENDQQRGHAPLERMPEHFEIPYGLINTHAKTIGIHAVAVAVALSMYQDRGDPEPHEPRLCRDLGLTKYDVRRAMRTLVEAKLVEWE